jgi:hypothetical protein
MLRRDHVEAVLGFVTYVTRCAQPASLSGRMLLGAMMMLS